MTITTQNWARLMFPGLNRIYTESYNEWPTQYTDLFDVDSSSRQYEEIIGTTGFSQAQVVTEGGTFPYMQDSQAYLSRFAHLVYGLGYIITRIAMEDNLYPEVGKRRSKKLAFSIRQTVETVHANIYNRAFNSSFTGGDGLELLSTLHPNFAGGTWSNELSTAADLSEAALEQACIDIMRWENDAGLKIQVTPQTLIVPPELTAEAHRILQTPYRVNTADNDINYLKMAGKFPGGIKTNIYLTGTKAWFLRTNCPDGMLSFTRRPMEFTQDNDFDTENAKFKASIRFSAGWGDPKGLFGSPGVS